MSTTAKSIPKINSTPCTSTACLFCGPALCLLRAFQSAPVAPHTLSHTNEYSYYTEKDRYGALLIMSKLQHETLRGLFNKYAKRVSNSMLLSSEQFPKFLEAMNASKVIPWQLLKGGEEDEFGDAEKRSQPLESV